MTADNRPPQILVPITSKKKTSGNDRFMLWNIRGADALPNKLHELTTCVASNDPHQVLFELKFNRYDLMESAS